MRLFFFLPDVLNEWMSEQDEYRHDSHIYNFRDTKLKFFFLIS